MGRSKKWLIEYVEQSLQFDQRANLVGCHSDRVEVSQTDDLVDILAFIKFGLIPLPTIEWFAVTFLLSPIISFIITMASIIISSKSTDIRSAQGIGAVVIFPIYAIIGLQLAGLFLLNIRYLLIGCAVLLAICPLVLKLATRIFDRENILTRWKMK